MAALARTLRSYRGWEARSLLLRLCAHPCAEVREAAAESLLDSPSQQAYTLLAPFMGDAAVARVLRERIESCS